MNQTAYQMNRENNNSNNERNPFQRNGKSNGYSNNRGGYSQGGGYKDWKKGGSAPYTAYGTPPPPKEKVLTADDFPSLPGAAPTQAKGVWGLKQPAKPKEDDSDSESEAPVVTLADRMKEVIAKEEEARLRGLAEKEEEEDLYVIPLSNWLRSKHLAKKHEEEMKKREYEAYEANYRWQIDPRMIPPKPEPSMAEYDEELQEEGFVEGAEVLEEVEER